MKCWLFLAMLVCLGATAQNESSDRGMGRMESVLPPTIDPERGRTEARELVDDLLLRKPTENLKSNGALKIRNAQGKNVVIPVLFQTQIAADQWQTSYETAPTNNAPAEKLVIIHAPFQPNRYLVFVRTNAAQEWKETELMPGEASARPFAGSDYWICDLGLEFLHWPEQRLQKKEMRKGRPCKVLESRCEKPAGAQYSRVLSWVDAETGGVLMAEAYDAQNKLVKVFEVRSLQKVNDQWQLKRLTISNPILDTRTHWDLDLDVKE